MVYALVLTLTLLNGSKAPVVVDIYDDVEQCRVEAAHQIMQGIDADKLSCDPMDVL